MSTTKKTGRVILIIILSILAIIVLFRFAFNFRVWYGEEQVTQRNAPQTTSPTVTTNFMVMPGGWYEVKVDQWAGPCEVKPVNAYDPIDWYAIVERNSDTNTYSMNRENKDMKWGDGAKRILVSLPANASHGEEFQVTKKRK